MIRPSERVRMPRLTLFEMWEPLRELRISTHKFYIEEACQRLLSQFENINEEADKAAEDWLSLQSGNFNPDQHDVGDFYERANDAGIQFYLLLQDMRERTRLSVVAGMYHEWDKQFRKWTVDEIKHWYREDNLLTKIWTVDVGRLSELFAALGWDIQNKNYFPKLMACRLVVNVFKHGDGTSLDELKLHNPEYLQTPFKELNGCFSDVGHLDHSYLKVSDEQINEFSEAITAFWLDVPRLIDDSYSAQLPKWFENAVLSDQKAIRNTKNK